LSEPQRDVFGDCGLDDATLVGSIVPHKEVLGVGARAVVILEDCVSSSGVAQREVCLYAEVRGLLFVCCVEEDPIKVLDAAHKEVSWLVLRLLGHKERPVDGLLSSLNTECLKWYVAFVELDICCVYL
tara:strand:- start:125 stop:508 length:384 start_codon:yes stop_codon:yes gene_type:complete